MNRIDDARAAEMQALCAAWCREGIGTEPFRAADRQLRGMAINTIIAFLADRADYKARIEDLERERNQWRREHAWMTRERDRARALQPIAQLPTPSPTDAPASDTRGPNIVLLVKSLDLFVKATESAAGDNWDGVDSVASGMFEEAAGLAKAALQDCKPASDTRALAVEICEEVLAVQASMRGAPYADRAVANVERILRKALEVK